MVVTSGCNTEKRVLNSLGTLDQVIQENKIFTALAKMPEEVQTTLLQNGWIGKDSFNENPNVLSLHTNSERVKAVVKRYETGLIWTDEHSRGMNWSELHPMVVVNKFPRDGNAVLNICGHAMAGKSQFDCYYPRAYPVTEVTVASLFASDYSLTACASLLFAFVDGCGIKCSKNGQVPLSALHFALNKCEHYANAAAAAAAAADDRTDLTGDGAEWHAFFQHYHQVVDDNQKFAVPADGDVELAALVTASKRALGRLKACRPQTAMDGRRNVWTIKCNRPTGPRPHLTNRIDDILERCGRARAANDDCVVQKYVETPLLAKNDRFDVRAWLAVSTLDGRLAVWLYQTCFVHRRPHRLSVDTDHRGRPVARVRGAKSHRHAARGPMQTCGLRQLRGKLRAAAASADKNRGDSAVWLAIRRSIESSALAAADVLNLRPNCFELFQATFVMGADFHPWLIDIESDPWIARGHQHQHAESSVAGGVAKGLAKILIHRHCESEIKIGMFDLLHRCSIPGEPYEPRPFNEKPVPKKCDRTRVKTYDIVRHGHDEFINTYVERIQADETDNRHLARNVSIYSIQDGVELNKKQRSEILNTDNNLCLNDLEVSMNRLRLGPGIDQHEAKYCLRLLDNWKTKVMSAQRFYKTVLTSNRS